MADKVSKNGSGCITLSFVSNRGSFYCGLIGQVEVSQPSHTVGNICTSLLPNTDYPFKHTFSIFHHHQHIMQFSSKIGWVHSHSSTMLSIYPLSYGAT